MSELDPKTIIKEYLSKAKIMQLATVREGQPWICSLHFAADDEDNIYWISKASTRHSEDIMINSAVAITVAVKTEGSLVGVQAEGVAELVTDNDQVASIMDEYIKHHGTDRAFVDTIVAGTNPHKLYAFRPKRFSLFDQVNFADQPSQEWVIDTKK